MALVLNIKEGDSFFVADMEYTMHRVVAQNRIILKEHSFMPKLIEVDDKTRIKISEGVFVQAAESWRPKIGRVAIEAPKDIKILRDTLYNKG